jgi:hypothetical protein
MADLRHDLVWVSSVIPNLTAAMRFEVWLVVVSAEAQLLREGYRERSDSCD